MSDHLHYFKAADGVVAAALPLELDKAVEDWETLRQRMIREIPPSFSRDEWAYLVTFLDHRNLNRFFRSAFGSGPTKAESPRRLYRPSGPIAVWLPNNVSLLGPLMLVALSLTGQPLFLKLGSQTEDLTETFLDFARRNLPDGPLQRHMEQTVKAERMSRNDPRQEEWSSQSQVRIMFGSDDTVAAIEKLAHPVTSQAVIFADRHSEAWVEPQALDADVLHTLIRVFTIYGQAGCTSPRRIVLLNGSPVDAVRLRDELGDLWPNIQNRDVPMHTASENVLSEQMARIQGWNSIRTSRNAAVLSCGTADLPQPDGKMNLQIISATPEEALNSLSSNIQSIGHALTNPSDTKWLKLIARSPALRFVPLARMHHFGSPWDGQEFWRQCFDCVEVDV